MHRSSTAQSPVRTSQVHSRSVTEKSLLHPVLQNALASLDTQLEDELSRYRRQRSLGKATYTPRSQPQRQVRASLDVISVLSSQDIQPESSTAAFHPTASVPPLVAITPVAEMSSSTPTVSELKELAKQYASEVAASSDAASTGSPDDYLESSEELLRTLSQEEAQVKAEQSFMQSLLTPLGLGSMLLLLMSSALFGFIIMNPNSISQLLNRSEKVASHAPDSVSSSTGEAPAVTGPQPNLANQEFPELALGNLGSIPADTTGTGTTPAVPPTAAKPGMVTAHLGVSGMVRVAPSPGMPNLPASPQVGAPSAEPAPPAGDVPSPRKLAPAIGDNPPPARAYNPPPARSYSPPPARAYNPPPARSYSPPPPIKPYTPPAKPVAPPKSNPLPTGDRTPLPPAPSPAASVAPTVNQPSSYKVVTPYTSDKTLEEYRGKVPDAYVKNYSDGAKVQFGAYQDETSAKSQAEELRKQGIPAEVYKP